MTKASVTIVFDNRVKKDSPVGFDGHDTITVTRQVRLVLLARLLSSLACDRPVEKAKRLIACACLKHACTFQIAVGGITKYMLNGHKTTLVTLQSLFQSVQLNINNPNFLIMQGKITKVLNMKPQEILGMVEEASGTRMFEERKDKAWKTMGKKDKKVAEMEAVSFHATLPAVETIMGLTRSPLRLSLSHDQLLKEEITPKLDSLRAEKRAFLAYQKTTTELERLTRLVKAAEWMEAQKRVGKSAEVVQEGQRIVSEKKELVGWLEEKKGRMEKEVESVLKKREKVRFAFDFWLLVARGGRPH